MCRSGIEGGEAKIDSKIEESLYDEEHDSTYGLESSIAQQATRPSSGFTVAYGHNKLFEGR
jgi:hypothetical protein